MRFRQPDPSRPPDWPDWIAVALGGVAVFTAVWLLTGLWPQ
jgi:hypothetical protein